MLGLRQTLILVHEILSSNNIQHSLIGGLALTHYGSTRSTQDVDLLIHEADKSRVVTKMIESGFIKVYESADVIQFEGRGLVDFLIARRPLSQEMLASSKKDGVENIQFVQPEDLIALKIQAYKNDPSRAFQDKADIQFIIENVEDLDWNKIKKYADLFNEWEVINEIKKTSRL